jgi:hypothetical protein
MPRHRATSPSTTIKRIRAKLATRGEPCYVAAPGHKPNDKTCPGWFVNTENLRIERCDDCWAGHSNKLEDHEAAKLPEAQAALADFYRRHSIDQDED